MEKIIKLTKTKNLLLYFAPNPDTFYVRNRNTADIIFKYYDLTTLVYWTITKYDLYPSEELQQIIGDTATFITEQNNRYRNLLDTVFQKNDDTNEA